MIELETGLANWCASYAKAFGEYDAAKIEAHWSFPALIFQKGRTLTLGSAEQFTANTEFLLKFYKREGVAAADRKLLSCMRMDDNTAAMTVEDRILDAEGNEIITWQVAYVMQQIDGGWRAVCAAADGETAAWEARGTPLGS